MKGGIVFNEGAWGGKEGLGARRARGGAAAEDVSCYTVTVVDQVVCMGVVRGGQMANEGVFACEEGAGA